MSVLAKIIGYGALALIAVGFMHFSLGVFDGSNQPTPQELQRNINNQFADVGLTVPQHGGGNSRYPGAGNPGSYPPPYNSVPQGTDLPGQLQGQSDDGPLFAPGR